MVTRRLGPGNNNPRETVWMARALLSPVWISLRRFAPCSHTNPYSFRQEGLLAVEIIKSPTWNSCVCWLLSSM